MLNPDQCEARVSVLDGDRTAAIVVLVGELDKTSVAGVVDDLDRLLPPAPCELIVDLAGLTFMDTGGLDVLDHLHRRGYVVEPSAVDPLVSLVLGYWTEPHPV